MDGLSDLEADQNGTKICVNKIRKCTAGRNAASGNAMLF
jgi:hypothetical protein